MPALAPARSTSNTDVPLVNVRLPLIVNRPGIEASPTATPGVSVPEPLTIRGCKPWTADPFGG